MKFISSIRTTFLSFTALTLVSCGNQNETPETGEEITETITEQTVTSPETTVEATATSLSGDTMSTSSGLRYIILQNGNGEFPKAGQTVSVHYTGTLTDGSKFDSSVERGQPLSFVLGAGQVIRGWDEGIGLLDKGAKVRLIIPHQLGYGERGMPPVIPPSSTLIFDVELVDFK
jgi:peptidylprolyl isomerase